MKKERFVILLLLLLAIPAVKSLFISGGFTSHDLTHHVVRQISMDKLLSEGQFPPRWSGELASGYGYPLFLFNYPLPPLIGQVFHILGFNFLDSVKAVFFLSLVLSTLGMYLFLKSFFNSYLSAFLGAMFYLYAPIHLITVYVSGSPGAAMGLVFPPFIFWSMVKLSKRDPKFLLIGAVSFAGMVLSHNISAVIFMPLIFIFGAYLILGTQERGKLLKAFLVMFLLGLGLSAFFWLPALIEKQYIRYDQLMKQVYINQFPSLKQIIYSPWGYGLSHPKQSAGGMSYQIGLAHLGVLVLLGILIWKFRKNKTFLFMGLFAIFSSVVAIFFMLETSLPFWDKIPFLPYIQFPVRLLLVPVFCASFGAGLLIKYLPFRKGLFLFLLFLVLYANRNHLGINQKYDPGEQYYLSLKTSATSFDEDLPNFVKIMKTDSNHGKFSGVSDIRVIEDKSAKVLAEVEATGSSRLQFNQYYFPGWEILVDKKLVKFDYSNQNGLPIFEVEKGKHVVLAQFKNTSVRTVADLVSLVSVIIWLSLLCKLLIRK